MALVGAHEVGEHLDRVGVEYGGVVGDVFTPHDLFEEAIDFGRDGHWVSFLRVLGGRFP